jgi:hypothetical protein
VRLTSYTINLYKKIRYCMKVFSELTNNEKAIALSQLRRRLATYLYKKSLITDRLQQNAKIIFKRANHIIAADIRN